RRAAPRLHVDPQVLRVPLAEHLRLLRLEEDPADPRHLLHARLACGSGRFLRSIRTMHRGGFRRKAVKCAAPARQEAGAGANLSDEDGRQTAWTSSTSGTAERMRRSI